MRDEKWRTEAENERQRAREREREPERETDSQKDWQTKEKEKKFKEFWNSCHCVCFVHNNPGICILIFFYFLF